MNSLAVTIFLQYIVYGTVPAVRACARSGGSTIPATTSSPTATATPCSNPPNTSGIIVDVPANQINSQNANVGTCPCSNGLTEQFYTSQSANQANDIADLDVQCTDMTQFCACDASGTCYQPTSNSVNDVQIYSHCDTECHMYAVIIAGANGEGLTDGTTTFTFGQQLDANGNPLPFSSSDNTYLKPVSVSCSGCNNIRGATCRGPFTSA